MYTSCYNDPCSLPGFSPAPTPWNPSIIPEGPEMAISAIVINEAVYFKAGKVVWFNINASFTLTLVPPALAGPPYMLFSLPLPVKTEYSFGGACTVNAGSGLVAGPWFMQHLSNINVRVGANNPNVWNAGTFRVILGSGFYEAL